MSALKINVLVFMLLVVNFAMSRTILEAPMSQEKIETIAAVGKDIREHADKPASLGKYFIWFLYC